MGCRLSRTTKGQNSVDGREVTQEQEQVTTGNLNKPSDQPNRKPTNAAVFASFGGGLEEL